MQVFNVIPTAQHSVKTIIFNMQVCGELTWLHTIHIKLRLHNLS